MLPSLPFVFSYSYFIFFSFFVLFWLCSFVSFPRGFLFMHFTSVLLKLFPLANVFSMSAGFWWLKALHFSSSFHSISHRDKNQLLSPLGHLQFLPVQSQTSHLLTYSYCVIIQIMWNLPGIFLLSPFLKSMV